MASHSRPHADPVDHRPPPERDWFAEFRAEEEMDPAWSEPPPPEADPFDFFAREETPPTIAPSPPRPSPVHVEAAPTAAPVVERRWLPIAAACTAVLAPGSVVAVMVLSMLQVSPPELPPAPVWAIEIAAPVPPPPLLPPAEPAVTPPPTPTATPAATPPPVAPARQLAAAPPPRTPPRTTPPPPPPSPAFAMSVDAAGSALPVGGGSTVSLSAPDVPKPPPTTPPPPASPPPDPVAAAVKADTAAIDSVLGGYRRGFNALDVALVRQVWPAADSRALERAFRGLAKQTLEFDACHINPVGSGAFAICSGRASYVTKIGARATQVESREWQFTLAKTGDRWVITAVETKR